MEMTEVLLKGTILVKGIKKKTNAQYFKELSEGDIIYLEYDLNGRYGSLAPEIKVNFLEHSFITTSLLFKKRMDNFEYEQIS